MPEPLYTLEVYLFDAPVSEKFAEANPVVCRAFSHAGEDGEQDRREDRDHTSSSIGVKPHFMELSSRLSRRLPGTSPVLPPHAVPMLPNNYSTAAVMEATAKSRLPDLTTHQQRVEWMMQCQWSPVLSTGKG